MVNNKRRNNRNRQRGARNRTFNAARGMAGNFAQGGTQTMGVTIDQQPLTMVTPDVPRLRLSPRKQYTVMRTLLLSNLAAPTAVDTFYSITVQLNNLPDAGDFTALFDEYKILQCTAVITPFNPMGIAGPIYSVIDYDDAAGITGAQAREYNSFCLSPSNQVIRRTWVPKVSLATYSGAFTSFSNSRPWCQTASPGIVWYGLKLLAVAIASANQTWQVTVECVIGLRNTI